MAMNQKNLLENMSYAVVNTEGLWARVVLIAQLESPFIHL